MLASYATNHGCLVTFCFTTASSRASFLGVQPSECQTYIEKARTPPLTLTHAWQCFLRCLGSKQPHLLLLQLLLPGCCRMPQKKPSRRVLLIVTACPFICDSRCVGCKPPSFLGFSVTAPPFHPSSIGALSQKYIALPFVSSHVFLFCTPSRPIEQGAPQLFCFFPHFSSVVSVSMMLSTVKFARSP